MFSDELGYLHTVWETRKEAELFQERKNFYRVEPQHWGGRVWNPVSICSCYPFTRETNPRRKTKRRQIKTWRINFEGAGSLKKCTFFLLTCYSVTEINFSGRILDAYLFPNKGNHILQNFQHPHWFCFQWEVIPVELGFQVALERFSNGRVSLAFCRCIQ